MKTSELTGRSLDYAVAVCEGGEGFWYDTVATYWVKIHGKDRALSNGWAQSYTPSTDWSEAGPIIERERLCITATQSAHWDARTAEYPPRYHSGPNPLVAAMRAYVASKLGDEVTVPNELL